MNVRSCRGWFACCVGLRRKMRQGLDWLRFFQYWIGAAAAAGPMHEARDPPTARRPTRPPRALQCGGTSVALTTM
jgi:hypothetical protein